MKKFKMWYIKLAFAALFFALIAQISQENIIPEVVVTKQVNAQVEKETETKKPTKAVIQLAGIAHDGGVFKK